MMRDFILSPCPLAAAGLAGLMHTSRMPPIVLSPETPTIPDKLIARRIVVFIPDDPYWLLFTLRQAARLLEQSKRPLSMLILSRYPPAWLWQTLLNQLVINKHLVSSVWWAASDLPCRELGALLQNDLPENLQLRKVSQFETLINRKRPEGLSKSELNVILDWLRGHRIITVAKRLGLSDKTLYNLRTSGLRKMVEHHPPLAAYFPGRQSKRLREKALGGLSAFEREFVHAIHTRQIFSVFQPIIDGRMQVQGMEILPRWQRNDKVLLPGEFLPQVHSEYAWLALAAFMLLEAVQNINQQPGKCGFSVNIPSAIASNENLIWMIETAHQQLSQPQMSERLVLEFTEIIDPNRQSHIDTNIARLRLRGFSIMLGGCFSQGSTMFPAPAARFSAYKLERGIVNDMQQDTHALTLIKNLVYYCQLTGSRCIAEGVDSLEKFNKLKALGIDRFQGDLISPPIGLENMTDLIHRFSADHNITRIAG